MKAKLLKKARNRVKIVNRNNVLAGRNDKFVTVSIKDVNGKIYNICTPKGKIAYSSYNTAILRCRKEIILLAKRMLSKNWLWHVFN